MKILIVTPHFYPENFRINDFAESFSTRGHNITVLTAIPDYPGGKFYKGFGYFKNNTATKESFTADGWYRTGDLGWIDRDGYFFVTGRIKEIIIKGGENISPREIDDVLYSHPAVFWIFSENPLPVEVLWEVHKT